MTLWPSMSACLLFAAFSVSQPATSATAAAPAAAASQWPAAELSRGRLLYDNHCIACHSVELHWRARRRVTDWTSLVDQVRQWQARAQLNWSEADIVEVARHLDQTIYRLPKAPVKATLRPGRPDASPRG